MPPASTSGGPAEIAGNEAAFTLGAERPRVHRAGRLSCDGAAALRCAVHLPRCARAARGWAARRALFWFWVLLGLSFFPVSVASGSFASKRFHGFRMCRAGVCRVKWTPNSGPRAKVESAPSKAGAENEEDPHKA